MPGLISVFASNKSDVKIKAMFVFITKSLDIQKKTQTRT